MTVDFLHYAIDTLIGLGIIVASVPYIRGTYKKGKDDAQEESNNILRNLVNDQKKAIENLVAWQKVATAKISALEVQVKVINEKRTDLAEIIEKSLDSFFEAHPDLAVNTRAKLNDQNV